MGQSRITALSLAAAVLAACLFFAWSEFRVATNVVPRADALVKVEGDLETCVYDGRGLLEPFQKMHGGWRGGADYVLTVKGVPGQFRTPVFRCGVAEASPGPHWIAFAVDGNAAEPQSGDSAPRSTYGYTVNGVVHRNAEDDLQLHRRAHDLLSPINTAGLGLLALIVPMCTYRAVRRRYSPGNAQSTQGP
jgi:hypothetical protein